MGRHLLECLRVHAELLEAAASDLYCWLGWVTKDPPFNLSRPRRLPKTKWAVTHGCVTLGKILKFSEPPGSYMLQKACYISHSKGLTETFQASKKLFYSCLYLQWAWQTVCAH